MKKSTVKISSIVEYQLPEFIRIEFPLLGQFLKEYYNYTETSFGPVDILKNISNYIKIDVLNQVTDQFYLYNSQIKISKILKDSSVKNIILVCAEEFDFISDDFILIDNTFDEELDGKIFKITVLSDEDKINNGLNSSDYAFFLNDTKQGFSLKAVSPFKIKSSVTEEVVEYQNGNPEIFIGDGDEIFAQIGEKIEIYDVFGQQLILTVVATGFNNPIAADLGTRSNGDRNIGLIKKVPISIGNVTNNSISDVSKEIIIYSENNDIKSLSVKYGLIKINDEIILYKDISNVNIDLNIGNKKYTGIKLLNCSRGFSGITSLVEKEDELTFEKTFAASHSIGSEILNLNSIFLKEFLTKIKYQILPGFENRELNSKLNQSLFIKQAKDFYSSKGTETSFKILFSALYDKKVSVIRPSEFLISPSNASYGVLRNLVVESLEGDPEELLNKTLYQDEVSFIPPARGTISFVERIERDYKSYYIISIDDGYERDINYRGTLFSQFTIHPKTLVTEDVEIGSTTITVDSTLSFPDSGILEIETLIPIEVNGSVVLTGPFKFSISYESKSNTQFYGCKTIGSITNIIENVILSSSVVYSDAYAYGFSDEDPSKRIKVRISGVLSNFIQNEETYLYEKENRIRIESLGKESVSTRDNNWIYNIPVSYVIKNVILKNELNKIYEIEFYDDHNFYRSNVFSVQEDPSLECYVTNIISKTKINVRFVKDGVEGFIVDLEQSKKWTLNKQISKARLLGQQNLLNYSANVQNTYIDKENNLYVVSSSLPTYTDAAGSQFDLDIKDGSISGTFLFGKITSNGSASQLSNKLFTDGSIDYSYITAFREGSNGLESAVKHGFYTGDQVIFRSLEEGKSPIPNGIYYIKDFRVDGDLYGFKLARSTSLIINERYETLDLIPPFNVPEFDQCECTLQFFEYSNVDVSKNNYLLPSTIGPRKIIKKISDPIKGQSKIDTGVGKIGIFKNGVEILNYKSRNSIFYGGIEKINVTSPGYGYDIVNAPDLKISDFGGTQVKYNSEKSTPIFNFLDGRPIKFGAVGGDVITYDGDIDPQTQLPYGNKILVNGKTLNFGNKNLYINQVAGKTLRISGLVATVGGEGGTQLSIGGLGGFEVRIGDENVTVGDLGTGCICFPSITGNLERIDLIYQGFNYIGDPKIYITGGNGFGAIAKPIMESFEYQIEFPASLNNGFLDIQNNIIGFSTYHNFENYEEVLYISGSSTNPILGLQNNSRYIISVEDSENVKLYKSKPDAIVGINTVEINSFSSGKHYLKSSKNKSKIGYISVVNSGSNYRNRKTSTIPEKINPISNIIEIQNHGYSSGELIIHFSSETAIGGIQQNVPYYVTKIDDNNIKLSEVFVGSDNTKDFYYRTNQFVNITNSGSGIHYFNYEPINVEVKGFIGVSTSSGQDLNAKVQPIFRGEIDSIFISNSGNNYGSSDILNYTKQPLVEVIKGTNAQAIPLISNGTIQEVLILNSGKDYKSIPDVVVRGDGAGAVLVPTIKDGKLVSINVLYGGINYTRNTTVIEIIDRGEGLRTSSQIKSWNVNLLKRYENNQRITRDEGFVFSELSSDSLQYTHIYLPDSIRILSYSGISSTFYNDIDSDANNAVSYHSPIVGWAYDGNPIYGPYGYKNGSAGTISAMQSSYKLVESRENGPSISVFPLGFFVEDYRYEDSSNKGTEYLDEHNGRFCKTPEYPKGTYAYFCTVDTLIKKQSVDSFIPKFPYIIGNSYYSLPIDFNFEQKNNQDGIDINKTGWYRNTTPYNLNRQFSSYKYFEQPNKIKEPVSKVKYASYGQIEFADVILGGEDYKIGDKIIFKNKDVIGQDATAEISSLEGRQVNSISVLRSSFNNVEFEKTPNKQSIIGFVNEPHEYNNGDIISITTPVERISLKEIKTISNKLTLNNTLKTRQQTGIVTSIEVSGNLNYPFIRENDVYKFIDNQDNEEVIKILNVDFQKSTIRIEREVNGPSGLTTVYSGTEFLELSRKFEVNLGIQTSYNLNSNYEYYFNSLESVGFGTDNSSSGITSTVYSKYTGNSIVIPQRSIYLPGHKFETNQALRFFGGLYYNKGGQSLNTLLSDQIVYAIKINNDLIGLSTTTVGFGSTGSVVGPNNQDPLVYFSSFTGDTENSLTTLRTNVFKAKISQNVVTVSTAATHGLISGDFVDIKLKPKNEINIVVEYNDENRLMILNPKSFLSGDVDTSENTLTIQNHQLITKDKILYRSIDSNGDLVAEIGGLTDNQIYYVVAIDRNTIALCETLYETTLEFPNYINLSSSSVGKIYQINPQIIAIKNQTINFDLSHPSLSVSSGNSIVRTSSFTFDVYEDGNFNYKYFSSGKSKQFDVTKVGAIGVTPNASLKLYLSDESPNNLYYKLTPIQFENNPTSKLNILIDKEQIKNNRITTIDSKYNGTYKIFEVLDNNPNDPPFTDATFKYQIPREPESDSYTIENCAITYETNSSLAFGPISKVALKNRGRYFYSLPQEIKIDSKIGSGAIVSAESKSIGKIKTVEILDIGFNYASDLTVSPITKLPTIFKVEPLYSIDKIRIDSTGVNYLAAPTIVVIDKKTNKKIEDLTLEYNLGDNFVTILQNTRNLSSTVPRLIPTNNSNGIPLLLNQADIIVLDANNNAIPQEVVNGVDNALLPDDSDESDFNFPDSIQFNNLTTIQVFLATEYSSIYDFPFELGDFVFIEDVVTIAESQGLESKGFNSSNNGYAFYKVVRRDPNIGGAGASITLDFKGYLDTQIQDPEDSDYYRVDDILSEGSRIVPVKYFPKYTVTLRKNNFVFNETIKTLSENGNSARGIVDQWDSVNDYIKIGVFGEFNVGDFIVGESSKTKAILINKISFDSAYSIDSTSIVNKGWSKDTGKLNLDLQRIHDSDYYQYFSYSLKSEVPIDKWDDPVSTLNHTAGFKRFSNLEVISSPKDEFSGIKTSQEFGVVTPITDIVSSASVNCVYDFDLVREISFTSNNSLKSNEIIFNSRVLQDYIESIDNRVLSIDDISKNFNPLPRETAFSIVSRTDSTKIRAKKHWFYIQDRRFSDEKQMLLLTTLHDDVNVYLGQYGRLETSYDMAYFESEIIGDNQNLLFYPARSEINNFIADYVSFEISDDPEDIEDLNFGSVSRVYNQIGSLQSGSPAGVGVTVVGIASTYRASKVLLLVGSASTSYYELNEISVIHDDRNNVRFQQYGELTTAMLDNESVVGIASYSAKMSENGSTLDILMTPYEQLTSDYNIKTINISVANTSFTTTDELGFDTGEVLSITNTGISTNIPQFVEVTNYSTQYKCQYLYLTITGIKTDAILPYNAGIQNHGISDWYAFSSGTATYAAVYPNTDIIEVTPDGAINTIVTTGSSPQRGTFSIVEGNRYYGTKSIHLIDAGEQDKIAPISYSSTIFGHYIADRTGNGIPTNVGVSSFFIYAIESESTVTMFDKDPNGISGIGSTSITIPIAKSGILTTNTYADWVFFTATSPVIITTSYRDPSIGGVVADRGLLSPAISATGASTIVKYMNNVGTDRKVTANNTTVSGISTIAFFGEETIVVVETADGAGGDMKQGIPLEYLSDTYSYGDTLSDYSIIAPYSNTVVNVSYWNGSSWILGETHNFGIISDVSLAEIQNRSGDTGFNIPAQPPFSSSLSGSASNLASGANLWKFESNNPVAIFINDSSDDETELLGVSSSFTQRPINKQYEAQEFQVINNSRNSYLTEYGKLSISDSSTSGISTSGIGTFSTRLEGSFTKLLFKPSPNTKYEIQGLQINVGRF